MATVFRRGDSPNGKRAKWRTRWKNAETDKWQTTIGYADKQATLALGDRLEQESARRSEGLIDPMREENKKAVAEHLAEFIARLEHAQRSPRYVLQVENRIRRIIEGAEIERLSNFSPSRVLGILNKLQFKGQPLSGITRNEYITTLKAFTNWAMESRKLNHDPLATLKRLERRVLTPRHPRRALTCEEIAQLLKATLRRPLLEAKTIRTGKNRGKPLANLSDELRERRIHLGRERRVCYLLAYWVGLRRSEIKQLLWADVDLESTPPMIRLRAEATKSKRADVQVMHPQLAEALNEWKPVDVGPATTVVSGVPCMNTIRADLKLASIDYGNAQIGYADLHAQRMSLSTAMAVQNLSPRIRQAHMRHTDPRLTNNTYIDPTLLPVAKELGTMPWIPEEGRVEREWRAVLPAQYGQE